MSDYRAYVPWVNRGDLLRRAVDSVEYLWPMLSIIDNSEVGLSGQWPCVVYRPPVPLTFSQSQNAMFADARQYGARFLIWFHADCQVPKGACEKLIDFVRSDLQAGKRVGVWYCYYDVLSAVNLAMVKEVGGYDTNIRAYKGDQDYYRRVRLAGWETVNTEIEVDALRRSHIGSQTIKNDPRLEFTNGIVQYLDSLYYQQKWRGDAGSETCDVPFDRPDLFGGKRWP